MKSLDFNMAKLPIWIQLGNVPLELFTKNRLSYIANAIGNPLYMDRITTKQQRLAFAKICVEVDANVEIPRFIEVKMQNGSIIAIKMEVPWRLQKCSQCKIFGHMDKNCLVKVSNPMAKVWIPKTKNDEMIGGEHVKKEMIEIPKERE